MTYKATQQLYTSKCQQFFQCFHQSCSLGIATRPHSFWMCLQSLQIQTRTCYWCSPQHSNVHAPKMVQSPASPALRAVERLKKKNTTGFHSFWGNSFHDEKEVQPKGQAAWTAKRYHRSLWINTKHRQHPITPPIVCPSKWIGQWDKWRWPAHHESRTPPEQRATTCCFGWQSY